MINRRNGFIGLNKQSFFFAEVTPELLNAGKYEVLA